MTHSDIENTTHKVRLIKPAAQITRELSAGGIVYKRVNDKILIGFILDPYHKWIFPKGHVEKGEGIRDAAVRETIEEMGFKSVRPKMKLGVISFTFKFRKKKIYKTVHYYLMEVDAHEMGTPQKKEKIKGIRWVPIAKARTILGYKNTRLVLDRAIDILNKMELRQLYKLKSSQSNVRNRFIHRRHNV